MAKAFKKQRTYRLRAQEISNILAHHLAEKDGLPNNEYDVRMETTVSPDDVKIKLRLKVHKAKTNERTK